MFASIRHLSPAAADTELDEFAAALRGGRMVALPSPDGYLIAVNADDERATATLEREGNGPRALMLPGKETFDLVFPAPGRLGRSLREVMAARPAYVKLPHRRYPDGLWVTILEPSLASRIVARARIPTFAVLVKGDDGKPLRKAAEVAKRMRSRVELILDARHAERTSPPLRLCALRAGVALVERGDASIGELERALVRRVLFVCLGNLNRSAFCEARINALAAQEAAHAEQCGISYVRAFVAESAGMIAASGSGSPEAMIRAAAGFSCDEQLRMHRARIYARKLGDAVDEIIALGADVREKLLAHGPADKVLSFGGKEYLPDPMGGEDDAYQSAAQAANRFLDEHYLAPGCRL